MRMISFHLYLLSPSCLLINTCLINSLPRTLVAQNSNIDKHAYLSSGAGKADRVLKLYQDPSVRQTMRPAHQYFPAVIKHSSDKNKLRA